MPTDQEPEPFIISPYQAPQESQESDKSFPRTAGCIGWVALNASSMLGFFGSFELVNERLAHDSVPVPLVLAAGVIMTVGSGWLVGRDK